MNIKSLLSTMLFAVALMLAFNYFFKPGGGGGAAPTEALSAYSSIPAYKSPEDDARRARQGDAAPVSQWIRDPAKNPEDKLYVKVSNITAGIDEVQLNLRDYAETVKRKEPLVLFSAVPTLAKPYSTLGIHILRGAKQTELSYGSDLPGKLKRRLDDFTRTKSVRPLTASEESELTGLTRLTADVGVKSVLDVVHEMENAGVKEDPELNAARTLIATANATNLLDTQYVWQVASSTPTSVTYRLVLEQDGAPLLEVLKTFELDPASYDMKVSHTLRNLLQHTFKGQAAGGMIELGQQNVSNVVVKAGDAVKVAGKDYSVDAATGKISIPAGSSIGNDPLTITYSLPDDILHVRIDQTGPSDLKRDDPQADDRLYHGLMLDVSKQAVDGGNGYSLGHALLPKTGGTAEMGTLNDFSKSPLLWVSSSNRFFASLIRPLPETGNTATFKLKNGDTIAKPGHVATANVDLMSVSAAKPVDNVAIMRLTGAAVDVTPGAPVEEPLAVFMGPKKLDILRGDPRAKPDTNDYAHAVYQYSKLIQFQTGCYSICIAGPVVDTILGLLNFLKSTVAFHNYGVAIMILVIVVRAVLHPLTRSSQISMAKMSKQMRDVQPQLDAIKKRYADDKKRQNEEIMRLYKEKNVNPAGSILGCLPMLIQMPIWAALYSGLRNDIDLRHAAFIPGWINDLASPDTVLPSGLPTLGHPPFSLPLIGDIYGLNLLPILLAGVFYVQMKVSTASQPKPADEQQAQMQKMSQWMIFLFPLFLYNAPSGLNLYIFASTMGGLLDTYLVRKTLKKQGILPATAETLPTHEEKA